MTTSTNPFDDGPSVVDTPSSPSRRTFSSNTTNLPPYLSSNKISTSNMVQSKRSSLHDSATNDTVSKNCNLLSSSSNEEAIWMARNVEWPLVSSLSSTTYRTLYRSSRMAGNALGIQYEFGSYGSNGGGTGIGLSGEGGVDATGGDGTEGTGGSAGHTGYYTTFGGLMGRVFTGGQTQSHAVDAQAEEDDPSTHRLSRPLRPPRPHCVASSNGWIVACIECLPLHNNNNTTNSTNTSNQSTTTSSHTSSNSNQTPIPTLRLLSRWNVRRSSSTIGAAGENLIPLPPPVRTPSSSSHSYFSSTSSSSDPSRIVHVFVDPTGCHTLLSAMNGEAYYLHSCTKKVRKLIGFGPNADGTASCQRGAASIEFNTKDGSPSSSKKIQLGLTTGSYVTSVGWDKKRGTEGSTKRILLGTSLGEVYEYSLVSPGTSSDGLGGADGGGVGAAGSLSGNGDGSDGSRLSSSGGGGSSGDDLPLLLVRLNSTESSGGGRSGSRGGNGGAVSGLHFERLGGGAQLVNMGGSKGSIEEDIIVLAVTSGTNKQTRLHTYLSNSGESTSSDGGSLSNHPGSSGNVFRNVFSNETCRSSFVELPGSINYADFKICGDGFALRTETGIYYGTIDRSDSVAGGNAVPIGKGGNGIVDAGILPYESLTGSASGNSSSAIPVSLAITPHHFITLNESNEVRFINRVAKKTIQKERVDWVTMAHVSASGSSMDDGLFGGVGIGELLMDIRRPDQVWIRKSRSLVHVSSSCEDRDVWKFTLEKCLSLPKYHQKSSPSRAVSTQLSMHRHSQNSSGLQLTSNEKFLDAKFEHAKSLCINNAQKAVVTAARAEFHLSQGRVELAAKYMAQCPPSLTPFAETAIRLALPMIGIDHPKTYCASLKANESLVNGNLGLITYLSDKMRLAKAQNDGVACTMIGAWLTELYLHELELGAYPGMQTTPGGLSRGSSTVNSAMLQQFLTSNVYNMDAKMVLSMLSSHDISASDCAGYAAASGDIETAVNAALCKEDGMNGALDALRVLNDSPIEQSEPVYYKHASTLLERVPVAAAKSFLSRFHHGLCAIKLLPAFMRYERKRAEFKEAQTKKDLNNEDDFHSSNIENIQIEGSRSLHDGSGVEIRIDQNANARQSIAFVDDDSASAKYLEGVITLGCQSTAVYNYLISLYASMEDEAPLFRFLSTHVPTAAASTFPLKNGLGELLLMQGAKQSTPLDMSYALRVILRSGRHYRSAVKLYMGFGMRQQAVELAIKVDPALARELVRESVGVDERKRLWLMIARNAAEYGDSPGGKDVVSKVVSVLDDCGPDILSIEDVLPFLPDVAQIDQFKEEICCALTSYSKKIEDYLKEMSECDKACDALREEIRRLNEYGSQMKGHARCAFTKRLVVNSNEAFYVFPSGFVVLENALKSEVIPYLNDKQRSRIEIIEKELLEVKTHLKHGTSSIWNDSDENVHRQEELQSELDGLIAAECPLTGSIMVDSIDRGFENNEDEIYGFSDDSIET